MDPVCLEGVTRFLFAPLLYPECCDGYCSAPSSGRQCGLRHFLWALCRGLVDPVLPHRTLGHPPRSGWFQSLAGATAGGHRTYSCPGRRGRASHIWPTSEVKKPTWWERLGVRWRGRGAQSTPRPAHPKTAFVLAGGGSRGAVQIGMLAELVARGVKADRVYGASVGAINGAAYAGNPTAEGVEQMEEIWRISPALRSFRDRLWTGHGCFYRNDLRCTPIQDCERSLRQESPTRISKMPLCPSSWSPHHSPMDGNGGSPTGMRLKPSLPRRPYRQFSHRSPLTEMCWWTAVWSTMRPISRAIAAGCTRIFVLLCGPLHYHPRQPRRPAEAALTAFFVAIHARFVRELTDLPPGVEVVVFSGGGEPAAQYRDFSGTAAMIAEGRAEVAEVLERYVGTSHDLTPQSVPTP